MSQPNHSAATIGFENELWRAADALRSNMDAAEYKHVVFGLIFLKYISDAFEEFHAHLTAEITTLGAGPEDPDEYRAENIFWVPKEARWSHLQDNARQPTVGKLVDDAIATLERGDPRYEDIPASANPPPSTTSAPTSTSSRPDATSARRRWRTTANPSRTKWNTSPPLCANKWPRPHSLTGRFGRIWRRLGMGSEWQTLSLQEAGVTLLDCEHRTPQPAIEGYPYIAIPQLKDGYIRLADVRLISYEDFVTWTRKTKPKPWDVIVSRRCNPGETAAVPPNLECALGQNLVILRADGKRVGPTFLRWLLQSPEWRQRVQSHINVGAVFDSLKCADIPNFRLPVPPLPEQRAIAHILGTLDDKIELNRQMNQALEDIARALFKSWFVDFDPVRVKTLGSPRSSVAVAGPEPGVPRVSPYIADLFPDEFVESELGEIPKGWRVGVLEELLMLQRGFDLPTQNRIPGSYQVIAASGPSTYHNEAKVRGPGVVTGRSGVLGKVFLVQDDFWPLNTTLWVKEFKGSKPHHAYFLLQRLDFSAFNAGSAVPTLNRNHIHNLPVVLPDPKIIDCFESTAKLVFDKIRANDKESNTLTALRDILLPKLISGELRVPDAERIVGRCV